MPRTKGQRSAAAAAAGGGIVHPSHLLCTTSQGRNQPSREYYAACRLPPTPSDVLARPLTNLPAKTKTKDKANNSKQKKEKQEKQENEEARMWPIHLGDAVILRCDDASRPSVVQPQARRKASLAREERVWYPYNRGWEVVQILSIYRDAADGTRLNQKGNKMQGKKKKREEEAEEASSGLMVEVRRMYRRSDLAAGQVPGLVGDSLLRTKTRANDKSKGKGKGKGGKDGGARGGAKKAPRAGDVEEVMETYRTVEDVPVEMIWGRARLWDEEGCEFDIRHRSTSKRLKDGKAAATSVPTLDFLCHRFYASNEEQVMPLINAADQSLDRALRHSRLVRKDGALRREIRQKLGVTTVFGEQERSGSVLSSMELEEEKEASWRLPPPFGSISSGTSSDSSASGSDQCYFDTVRIPANWSKYQYGREIAMRHVGDQRVVRWTARVGDVVAVLSDDAQPPRLKPYVQGKDGNPWYPFNRDIQWRPCRILAIYALEDDISPSKPTLRSSKAPASSWIDVAEDAASKIRFEVLPLYRYADAKLRDDIPTPRDKRMADDEALDVDLFDGLIPEEVDGEAILGPVTIISKEERTPPADWASDLELSARTPQPFFQSSRTVPKDVVRISNHYVCDKNLANDVETILRKASAFSKDEEGIRSEMKAKSASRKRPRQEMESEDDGESSSDSESDDSIFGRPGDNDRPDNDADAEATTKRARRDTDDGSDSAVVDTDGDDDQDSSSSDEDDNYKEGRYQTWASSSPYHVDVSSSRSYYTELHINPPYDHYAPIYSKSSRDKGDYYSWTVRLGDTVAVHYDMGGAGGASAKFPFTTTWAPGEVVCIWKQHKRSKKSFSSNGSLSDRGEMRMEVRWLYRQHEMPGSKRETFSSAKSDGLEEVVESDDTMDCPAAALLAPIKIYPTSVPCSVPVVDGLGMPVMSFHCHKFWSFHRKSMMPSGSAKGRVERGRMYSNYFGKDLLLKSALDKVLEKGSDAAAVSSRSSGTSKERLKNTFREVVSRLSLSDASADAQVKGMELTGRKKEIHQIKDFLRSAIQGSKSDSNEAESSVKSSIFIAGPPGTGKTACVKAVIAQLRHEQAGGKIPPFDFVSLNGMEMQYPFDAYVRLWEAVSQYKEKRAPGVAAAMLEKHFVGSSKSKSSNVDSEKSSCRPVTVVLLDEIDYLVTNKQSVLYNFFEWPRRSATSSDARLVVVGISNTINLPERLKPAVQSRLGRERCVFKAYNVDETTNILKARLSGGEGVKDVCSVFDKDALTFAARKTAVMSGDIRKAFQICKAAAENFLTKLEEDGEQNSVIVRAGGSTIIRIPDIQRAAKDMFNSIINKAVASATSFEALLIVSVASLQKSTGREKGGFDVQEILTKMKGVAESFGDRQYLPAPSFGELLGMLNRLGELRVLTLQTPKGLHASYHAALGGGGGAWPLVSLRMEDYEVEAALRGTPHGALAEKHLAEGRLIGF